MPSCMRYQQRCSPHPVINNKNLILSIDRNGFDTKKSSLYGCSKKENLVLLNIMFLLTDCNVNSNFFDDFILLNTNWEMEHI